MIESWYSSLTLFVVQYSSAYVHGEAAVQPWPTVAES